MEIPELYQIYLFIGMLIHKLVWEVLKRQSGSRAPEHTPWSWSLSNLMKVIKIAFLVFLVIQTLFLDSLFPITANPNAIRMIGIGIYTLGLVLAIVGRIQLGNNWVNLEDAQVLSHQQLVDAGIYRFIRHPIYSGDFLLVLGLELALNSWLVLIVLPLAIVIYRQANAEEKLLVEAFPQYPEYQRRTKMFLPYII